MSKKKIIICDDDKGIVDMLELLLEYSGADIASETNSLHIHALLLNENPQILIVDLWMPNISGDQVIRKVRETIELKNLKILAISASRDGEKIAMEAGADAFLAKPFDMDEILDTVEKLFEN